MGRIHAQSDITYMADEQPGGYLPSKKLVGYSVREEEPFPDPDGTIAVILPVASPEPATRLSLYPNISQEAIL